MCTHKHIQTHEHAHMHTCNHTHVYTHTTTHTYMTDSPISMTNSTNIFLTTSDLATIEVSYMFLLG